MLYLCYILYDKRGDRKTYQYTFAYIFQKKQETDKPNTDKNSYCIMKLFLKSKMA